MPDINERRDKLEETQKTLEQTHAIMAELLLSSSKRQKEHEAQLAAHQAQLAAHQDWLAKHEIAMQEFDGKLNAIINIIGRNQGGIEAKPE